MTAREGTPRCDIAENAEAWRDPGQWITELSVAWGLARQLERELTAARAEIAEAERRGMLRAAGICRRVMNNIGGNNPYPEAVIQASGANHCAAAIEREAGK